MNWEKRIELTKHQREKARRVARLAAQRLQLASPVILTDHQMQQLADLVEGLGETHVREALAFGTPIADLLEEQPK